MSKTAVEVIDELTKLVAKHGDKIMYANGCEVLDVYYDEEDDSINV